MQYTQARFGGLVIFILKKLLKNKVRKKQREGQMRKRFILVIACIVFCSLIWFLNLPAKPAAHATTTNNKYVYLPAIVKAPTPTPTPDPCEPIPGVSYTAFTIEGAPTDRPAAQHADLNLALRGYEPTNASRGLVDYGGGYDPNAPQLYGLFGDQRTPTFTQQYRVYDWDWGCNCRGNLLTTWPVTLSGMQTTPLEVIRVPDSGYNIGYGYDALVLYATRERITLKYTREDNVVHGYTVHIENICVEPSLLALYEQWNAAGRTSLPAVKGGQPIGRARGSEIRVAIRDNGTFMDPRSRKDWWRGR